MMITEVTLRNGILESIREDPVGSRDPGDPIVIPRMLHLKQWLELEYSDLGGESPWF